MRGPGVLLRPLAIAVVLGVSTATSAAAPVAADPASSRRVVGVRLRTFTDRSRPTPADVIAGITPARERRLPTTIFYPARGHASGAAAVPGAAPLEGRFPLVIFSPGAPGTPDDYAPLLTDIAGAGYVVAAVTFPVSSFAGPDAAAWRDLPAQTADVRFVLGRLLALDAATVGVPQIAGDHVASMGHSFGGATALSLVSECCRDRRVDAAVVLSGVVETLHGPTLRAPRGPVLFVHARRDPVVPYGPAAAKCTRVSGTRRLLAVDGIAGARAHTDPYLGSGDTAAAVRPAIVAFLDGFLRGRPSAQRSFDRTGDGTAPVTVSRCRA